jgi:argininosuccinate lyase
MPQKRNPDVLELVRAKAARVLAASAAVAAIVKGLPSGYHRDLQETKEPFLAGMETTRACLRVLAAFVRGVRPRPAALRAGLTAEVFATDRALELVREGVPFRTAYARVKAALADVAAPDPRKAVAERMRRGTAGIDFADLRGRLRAMRTFAGAERRRFRRAAARLIRQR